MNNDHIIRENTEANEEAKRPANVRLKTGIRAGGALPIRPQELWNIVESI